MESYFESPTPLTPFQKIEMITPLWKSLWEQQETPLDTIQGVQQTVASTTEQIKKMAQNDAIIKTSSTKVFNLSKIAQHAGIHNVQMFNAHQVHNSPYGSLPESDYHTIERNKGYNFRIGDLWNVDFEAMWRQNIMDKYSQPYRNSTGEWVGGYIQKRFEVDKWIPEETNMQLKPGQLRK